jgi:hypothetical protein
VLSFVVVVCGVTATQRARLVDLSQLAASPHGIAEGRLWQLGTNVLVVQSPTFWSLLAFTALGLLGLRRWVGALSGSTAWPDTSPRRSSRTACLPLSVCSSRTRSSAR